jgi:hypothetical protein
MKQKLLLSFFLLSFLGVLIMAIRYTNSKTQATRTTHIGCVIAEKVDSDYRAMSDVYTTADLACVWLPKEDTIKWIIVNVNYMGCDDSGSIFVDIHDGEYAEDYAIYLLIKEDERKAEEAGQAFRAGLERIKAAKGFCLEPAKGMVCRAVKGRKVAKGTEGIIFYIRDNRIGFKCVDGIAHWINDNQIETKLDGMEYGEAPEQGWLALRKEIQGKRDAAWKARVSNMSASEKRRYNIRSNY